MHYSFKLSMLALTIGVATTLLLYILVAQSPYVLGVGCILGVYLAKTPSLKSAAIHGAIVVIPLAVYINLIGSAGSATSPTILGKSISVFLFAVMGGAMGLVLEWIRNQLKKGTIFFS